MQVLQCPPRDAHVTGRGGQHDPGHPAQPAQIVDHPRAADHQPVAPESVGLVGAWVTTEVSNPAAYYPG